MKEIKVGRFNVALVDDGDEPLVSRYRWFLHRVGYSVYASTTVDGKYLSMHQLISGGEERSIDHADGNGLNNTRSNLRPCNQTQNLANSRKRRLTSSKFKGVYFNKRNGHWSADICSGGKRERLGQFEREEDAAHAYDEAASRLFGEFAKLNFEIDAFAAAGMAC